MNNLVWVALIGFFVSLLLTPVFRAAATRYDLFDIADKRKIHSGSIPRIGGAAIFFGFILSVLPFLDLSGPVISLLLAAGFLFIVGFVDDIRGLSPVTKLIAQICSALLVLTGGIGIVYISIPGIEGVIRLDQLIIPVEIFGNTYNIIPFANLFTIAWIVLIINSINLLDGLDGLAAGVSTIGLFTLLVLAGQGFGSISVVILATAILVSTGGFLVSNYHPARIFMGDSGAYVLGLMLATLPIYSGTKSTIGVIVIGVAIIDLIWAVLRRINRGQSPFAADRGHLHHRMLDSGIKHHNVVLLFYLIAIATSVVLLKYGLVSSLVVLVISVVCLIAATRVKVLNT